MPLLLHTNPHRERERRRDKKALYSSLLDFLQIYITFPIRNLVLLLYLLPKPKMWMMSYNDGGEYNKQDSFNGRKLRPLTLRPIPSPNNTPNSSSLSLSRLHGTEFFAPNQHLDQSKREFDAQPAVVMSSRWNPTPEQLRTLEELYRRGTRTPSADQIQQITVQLRRYGKIEGKNVFYWFQNHKARERQKRRRQMESAPHELHRDDEVHEGKESGSSYRTGNFKGEQTNSWGPSTNCSTLTEESASIQRAAKAAVAGCRPDGWIQFDEGELQHTRRFMERNATWQMMQLSCPPPTNLINSTNTSTATTSTTITSITTKSPTTVAATTKTPEEATMRTMDPKLIKTRDLMDLFIASHIETRNNVINIEDGSCGGGESQTLQLFPLGSNERESNREKDINFSEIPMGEAMSNANLTSFQFYEFLPLKN